MLKALCLRSVRVGAIKQCLVSSPNERTFLRASFNIDNNFRCKYTQHKGVKGIRPKKGAYETNTLAADEEVVGVPQNIDQLNIDDRAYDEIANSAMFVTRDFKATQIVLILQPYIKWSAKRQIDVDSNDQLKEAEALIRSLPNWQVACALKVPLESLERKMVFGSGKIEELKQLVQQLRQSRGGQQPLTCLFISKSTLTFAQKRSLEAEFKLPVMDRYSVVIQILRLHATSAEARLQVAMAELPYIWAQAKDANLSMARKQGYSLNDTQREILKTRERKLKIELEKVRSQRKLLRSKRKHKNFPIVAVVGYTNAGKTSLIKALTAEESLQPRDQLFATLDVTAHAGMLPCNLKVIYMDTVGFMSDLPTGLIECFVSTLEDAMLADIIVHVQDISHNSHVQQRKHVEETLNNLLKNMPHYDDEPLDRLELPPIINVVNKIDLLPQLPETNNSSNEYLVSTKTQSGLHDLLLAIEEQVLATTGRRKITMRVRNGGSEMSWLYKNAAVVDVTVDSQNAEMLLMNVIIVESTLEKFKRQFCQAAALR